jgi:hypothetical protein
MYKWCFVLMIFFVSCSKDPVPEVPTNTLVSTAVFTVGSSVQSFNNYLAEPISGFNRNRYSIPTASPILKIEVRPIFQTDSVNLRSQDLKFIYTEGTKTYVADGSQGDGYIKCIVNLSNEANVTIRDGSGNLKSAIRKEETFDARFAAKLINQAAPFDEVIITNGKLTRNGKFYVY